jgi:hypothetical protein
MIFITSTLLQLHRFYLSAINADCSAGSGGAQSCDLGLPNVQAGTPQVQSILAIVFATIAAVAVLVIVFAGFRMITSQGTPQETAKARNTIIYALVGLIVSLAAEAIVAFVLGKTS